MRLAIFASGGGTNFQAIARACQSGVLSAKCSLLITNRTCGAVEFARQLSVPAHIVALSKGKNFNEWDSQVCDLLQEQQVDLVVLAGFLKKIGPKVLKTFQGKILNIHPALLPKYGGAGMYGDHVHAAVIQAGETQSGSTVHWVTENFDEGPIVNQFKVDIDTGETAASLSQKIRDKEPQFYVDTLKQLLQK